MAHLKVSGYIRSEIELAIVMEGLNKVIVDAYEVSCPAKIVKSSREVAW